MLLPTIEFSQKCTYFCHKNYLSAVGGLPPAALGLSYMYIFIKSPRAAPRALVLLGEYFGGWEGGYQQSI